MTKRKLAKYEKLADQVYDLVTQEELSYGDILGSLELVRLWIYRDFMENNFVSLDDEDSNVDIIDIEDQDIPDDNKTKL